MRKTVVASFAIVLLAACSQDTGNSDDSDFYQGKTISYIVATDPGGGYDSYARLIGGYLQKYMPIDNVVIKNTPGAGHLVGANTLHRSKPNGLTIGTFNIGLIYGQLLGKAGMAFDLRDLAWVGKAAGEPRSIVVSNNCVIQSIDDLIAAEEPVKFGSAGLGSASWSDMMLLADALELKVEIVPGFEGNEGEMSMMRGEICAIMGSTSSFKNFLDSGYGHLILTVGGEIEGVPNAVDVARTDRAKRLVAIVDALAKLGRITAAPPGTPPARLEALRAAYKASLEDPQLRAEAARLGLPIDPAYGEEVEQLVIGALDQTPETVAMIKKAIDGTE
ncbi:MAG: Bug family tripartite tricarboxylate transporter substrate binding protein [Woeseiaceae bacterium]|jgi:tripartite-type tricarboxylate transporter receptor subunit TctC